MSVSVSPSAARSTDDVGSAFWVATKVTPFSVRKEIEEDQNVALGIILGAVILGISIIVAAAITS
ncbi:MAG: DUF350 domain-containing protein [Acidobacteriota bacterium]